MFEGGLYLVGKCFKISETMVSSFDNRSSIVLIFHLRVQVSFM